MTAQTGATNVWYHGSPEELVALPPGSTITQERELAAAFSHRPSLVVQGEGCIRHNGKLPGFLYALTDPVTSGDITPVLGSTLGPGQEWLTRRPLRLVLIDRTRPSPSGILSNAEVTPYQQRLSEYRRRHRR